ncbi:uncharacterized protein K444DRAFT_113481 [Hyaloscypha bicolor E]|uniref:Uncharacterized protein n=1 Tax=Hyaloscypha bicolor E TaxID=1095630 RepID=A0A2J6SVJ0_9HELO|nr:uncharacterized protein K444DRAFT_113481 [Hyaloscypha bicolor E]PMD54779.1 hypothetical protein K444DRAFT_113481 [Hyaloscypha bicolor E]
MYVWKRARISQSRSGRRERDQPLIRQSVRLSHPHKRSPPAHEREKKGVGEPYPQSINDHSSTPENTERERDRPSPCPAVSRTKYPQEDREREEGTCIRAHLLSQIQDLGL